MYDLFIGYASSYISTQVLPCAPLFEQYCALNFMHRKHCAIAVLRCLIDFCAQTCIVCNLFIDFFYAIIENSLSGCL